VCVTSILSLRFLPILREKYFLMQPSLSWTSSYFPFPMYLELHHGSKLQHSSITMIPTYTILRKYKRSPFQPSETLVDLFNGCKTAVLSGTKSVVCAHTPSGSGQNPPMWIITYWAEVFELRRTYQKAWVKAEEFLCRGKKLWKSTSAGECVDRVMQEGYDVLSYLLWSGNICGFNNDEPLHTLAVYASHEWFSTMHENQMLNLLRCDF
jgi:hypothetical protein